MGPVEVLIAYVLAVLILDRFQVYLQVIILIPNPIDRGFGPYSDLKLPVLPITTRFNINLHDNCLTQSKKINSSLKGGRKLILGTIKC